MKGGRFQYTPRTSKQLDTRVNQRGGNYDAITKGGIDSWRPKQGNNEVRILPPTWDNHEHYGFDIWVHRNVGPDNQTYLCLNKMKNKACPVCELHRQMEADGETDDAKQIAPKRSVGVWILDRDENKAMPKFYQMGWQLDRDIAALSKDEKRGRILLIDHPSEGYDVSFKRVGERLQTRYIGVQIDREQTAISTNPVRQKKVLAYITEHPIPDVLQYHDYDYIEKVLEGAKEEKDEDTDDEEANLSKDLAKLQKKARTMEYEELLEVIEEYGFDIDTDDFEDNPKSVKKLRAAVDKAILRASKIDEDDEDEEDESPKKKKKKRPADDDEDEEDESSGEDDEDDEEEERPKKKKKRPAEDDEDEDEDESSGDDDEDEESSEDDEDEDESPKKKKKKRPADDEDEEDESSEDDEDEEASNDEDDEEEERPKKKKKRPAEDDEDEEEDEPPKKKLKKVLKKKRRS